jgi:long-chain acyl-CoA synthetase
MVEEAILRHPAVEDVAVCGIPDDYRGETVKPSIIPRAEQKVTLSRLEGVPARQARSFEMPRSIAVRKTLPRTLIGKVSRKELIAEGDGEAALATDRDRLVLAPPASKGSIGARS